MEKLYKVFIAILIVVFSFVKSNNSFAQNLVDNWSFEDTVSCPTGVGQLFNTQGWVTYSGTPDYFNSCNQGSGGGSYNVNVPQNRIDYQNANSGQAYVGLLTYLILTPSVREFMGCQLNQSLQIGQKYFVSLYVSRAVNHTANYNLDVANNKIGVQFTTFPQIASNPATANNISQVYTDSIITDTLNWVQIKGSFVADSNYQYISVGNFFDGANTQFIQYYPNYTAAYYYFDDICVSPDSLYCDLLSSISQPTSSAQYSIYPNPARDWIVVGGNGIKSLRIYDVSGRGKLSFYQVITPFKIDVAHLSNGLYIIQIETKNGYAFQKLILNN